MDFEIPQVYDPSEREDWRRPGVLGRPEGSWAVERFRVTVAFDTAAITVTEERLQLYIKQGLERDHDRDFADAVVEEMAETAYVDVNWPGHGHHGEYSCDCGPDLPDDWPERIRPLVPLADLCRDHAQVSPCGECEDEVTMAVDSHDDVPPAARVE